MTAVEPVEQFNPYPPYILTDEDRERWDMCVALAARLVLLYEGHPDNGMQWHLTRWMFQTDIPTGTAADAAAVDAARLAAGIAPAPAKVEEAAVPHVAPTFKSRPTVGFHAQPPGLHPRDRVGQWASKIHAAVRTAAGQKIAGSQGAQVRARIVLHHVVHHALGEDVEHLRHMADTMQEVANFAINHHAELLATTHHVMALATAEQAVPVLRPLPGPDASEAELLAHLDHQADVLDELLPELPEHLGALRVAQAKAKRSSRGRRRRR